MIKLLSGNEYKTLTADRPDNSHKGSFGTAGLVCGSASYQGAAAFAASAALHTGVGIAVSFIPDCIYLPFASKISGAVIEPLESKNGMISDLSISAKIISRKCTAVLCGSGLGISDNTAKILWNVSQSDLPLVIDGDGLTLLAGDKSLLDRNAVTVLTAHIGEFSRLCEKTPEYIRKHRVSCAMSFAKEYGCTVVLKDYVTVIAHKDGTARIYSNPNSALSKGGSGDVLAGMLVSFLAQGYAPADAAEIAVTLHNACGSVCKKRHGAFYTQPEDLIASISGLL